MRPLSLRISGPSIRCPNDTATVSLFSIYSRLSCRYPEKAARNLTIRTILVIRLQYAPDVLLDLPRYLFLFFSREVTAIQLQLRYVTNISIDIYRWEMKLL